MRTKQIDWNALYQQAMGMMEVNGIYPQSLGGTKPRRCAYCRSAKTHAKCDSCGASQDAD